MTQRHILSAFASPALLLLAACGDDAAEPAPTDSTDNSAEGEIQGGSISDARPALEQVTSSAPPRSSASDDADGADSEAE